MIKVFLTFILVAALVYLSGTIEPCTVGTFVEQMACRGTL